MGLDKSGLIIDITSLLNTLKDYDGSGGKTQADAITKFANDLADAIDTYVKTATVSTTVTGTAPGPAFPSAVTGSGSGSLS